MVVAAGEVEAAVEAHDMEVGVTITTVTVMEGTGGEIYSGHEAFRLH